MTTTTADDLLARLARAAPGIYVSESEPTKVWLRIDEILAVQGHEYEEALAGITATKLIAMYANQGIEAVVIHDE